MDGNQIKFPRSQFNHNIEFNNNECESSVFQSDDKILNEKNDLQQQKEYQLLEKRDQFAMSLRNQKKKQIIKQKRELHNQKKEQYILEKKEFQVIKYEIPIFQRATFEQEYSYLINHINAIDQIKNDFRDQNLSEILLLQDEKDQIINLIKRIQELSQLLIEMEEKLNKNEYSSEQIEQIDFCFLDLSSNTDSAFHFIMDIYKYCILNVNHFISDSLGTQLILEFSDFFYQLSFFFSLQNYHKLILNLQIHKNYQLLLNSIFECMNDDFINIKNKKALQIFAIYILETIQYFLISLNNDQDLLKAIFDGLLEQFNIFDVFAQYFKNKNVLNSIAELISPIFYNMTSKLLLVNDQYIDIKLFQEFIIQTRFYFSIQIDNQYKNKILVENLICGISKLFTLQIKQENNLDLLVQFIQEENLIYFFSRYLNEPVNHSFYRIQDNVNSILYHLSFLPNSAFIKTLIDDLNVIDLLFVYFENVLEFQSQNLEMNINARIENHEIGNNLKNTLVSITNFIQIKEAKNKISELIEVLFKKNNQNMYYLSVFFKNNRFNKDCIIEMIYLLFIISKYGDDQDIFDLLNSKPLFKLIHQFIIDKDQKCLNHQIEREYLAFINSIFQRIANQSEDQFQLPQNYQIIFEKSDGINVLENIQIMSKNKENILMCEQIIKTYFQFEEFQLYESIYNNKSVQKNKDLYSQLNENNVYENDEATEFFMNMQSSFEDTKFNI